MLRCVGFRVVGLIVRSFVLVAVAAIASADQRTPRWTQGPATVDLGSEVAKIDLGGGHAFAGPEDTRRMLQAMGNTVDNTEVGMITPTAEDQNWMLLFEYEDAGYIKDDDKDKIDKGAILDSYRRGTEEANKTRKEKGIPALHITGWFEEPHYDSRTHNLVWALRAKNEGGDEVVNYNVRLLGRNGYMSVTLVDDPAKLAESKPHVDTLLSTFEYKKGRTYAEWVPGDKVAEYGLAALVAGGAGAAAVKMGLFATLFKAIAKGGKAIVLLLLGLGAGIKKMFTRSEPA
jgi:uncharacterized membrane-anchored protein